MAWQPYISSLMAEGNLLDACIAGFQPGQEAVWAAHPNGKLSTITVQEIKLLTSKDRSHFFSNGLTLGTIRCAVLRDRFYDESEHTIDLRTKTTSADEETYNICVACSKTALIIIMGVKGEHGGTLNKKAFNMANYLMSVGY